MVVVGVGVGMMVVIKYSDIPGWSSLNHDLAFRPDLDRALGTGISVAILYIDAWSRLIVLVSPKTLNIPCVRVIEYVGNTRTMIHYRQIKIMNYFVQSAHANHDVAYIKL